MKLKDELTGSYRIFALSYFTVFASICLLTVALFHIHYLVQLDKRLMVLLNFDGGEWMDNFWYLFSSRYLWIPMIAVIFISLFRSCKGNTSHKLLFILFCLILVVILDQVSSSIIKPLVGRLRPSHDPSICNMLHYVNGYHGGQYGFVSGHATNNVGIITWLCLIYKTKISRICLITYAIFLCYSRIYLGVHFFGDVLCGGILGFVIAYFSFKLINKHFDVSSEKLQKPILITLAVTVTFTFLYSTYQWLF